MSLGKQKNILAPDKDKHSQKFQNIPQRWNKHTHYSQENMEQTQHILGSIYYNSSHKRKGPVEKGLAQIMSERQILIPP